MPTIVVETRIDINDFASLVRYYQAKKSFLTKSGIISAAIGEFLSLLEEGGKISRSTDIEQSMAFVKGSGVDIKTMPKTKIGKDIVAQDAARPRVSMVIPDKYRLIEEVERSIEKK